MLELIKELCDECGVSGFERQVGLVIAEKIKDSCEALYFDELGNLIAFKKGKNRPDKRIMYCAHMDEVGFMIRHINDNGTLLFEQVGMMSQVLLSKRVVVGKNKLKGVICTKPVHLIKEKGQEVSWEDMYIDIGTCSKAESEALGVYADFACFDNDFSVLGNNRVCSKALDDRFGCSIMINMMKGDLEHDSYFAFTVGEELGGVGAVAAAREIEPDIAIVFEATTASDIPSNEGAQKVCSLGNGAVVPFMDAGTLYDSELYSRIRKIADENGIKTQTKSKVAGGTDAATIQRSLSGIRVAAVSLACRYIHSACCVADVGDMKECMRLAVAIDAQAKCLTK